MVEWSIGQPPHLPPDDSGQPGGSHQEQEASQLGRVYNVDSAYILCITQASLSLDRHFTSISQALKCIVVEIELLSLRLARSLSLIPAQHSTDVLRGAAYPAS